MKRVNKNKNISNKKSEETVLNLEESLTIWNAVKVKELISNALNNSSAIKLNFEGTKEYDFSFLQLLFSVFKTAEIQGKKIKLEKVPNDFENLLRNSGFLNINHSLFSEIKSGEELYV